MRKGRGRLTGRVPGPKRSRAATDPNQSLQAVMASYRRVLDIDSDYQPALDAICGVG